MDAEMEDLTGVEVEPSTSKRARNGNGRVRMTGNHVRFQNSKALQPLLANSDDTDTKSGESSDEELPNGTEVKASKPLIHSRQKVKVIVARRRGCYRCALPILGFVILGFCAVLVTSGFVYKYSRRIYWALHPPTKANAVVHLPCSSLNVSDVWVVGFPKLLTESAIRMVDVNGDGILDVILGFATGADGFNVPEFVCDIYFQSQKPCLGGVLALNGATGAVLWKHYTPHEIFAVNCIADLNKDNTSDCVIAGRAATLEAISGRDGTLLWTFVGSTARNDKMNVYTSQFVYDFDSDSVPEIVVAHGGDPFGEPGSATRLVGRLLIISGRHGRVLKWADVPDQRETYFSPVIYERNGGMPFVLFGSGGETHPGALWAIALTDLYAGRMDRAVSIYANRYKGIMTPPVLIDITGDNVLDIVLADFNSSVVAIDGERLTQIWNFTYQNSAETYATPAPGFYNNDSIPDFMITFQEGPGFPVYYKAMGTVLDGRTGQPILQPYLTSSVGAQTSPVTLSLEGAGQDMFIYWTADCKGHEGDGGGEFEFAKGTNIHEQSRTDFCRRRFQSYGYSRMMALSQFNTSPGFIIYNSELREDIEKSVWVNTTAEALTFLQDHPDYERMWQQSKRPQPKARRPPARRPVEEYPEERGESYDDNSNYYFNRRRGRRHVGPHDDDGVQRLISTGTLAPPLLPTNHSDYNRSMDIVFATYWFFPAKTEVLLAEDRACVEQRKAAEEERFDPASIYYGMDDDAYEHAVTTECLQKSGHLPEQGATYESQIAYDPFNIHMGQLTVYRLRLTCQCEVAPSAGQQCGQFVPFSSQQWAGYMGSKATSHWTSRAHT